ncbi:hypothetical protein Btru_000424 [Bulinus truncatus]|nr:hypothetical protein Btru_000424 [Bulinus truncatus]
MHTLYLDKNLAAGKSLVSYLTSQNVELDQIVLTFYIGLLGATTNNSADQENEVKSLFDKLKSKTEVLDAASIEVLISALSKTKYYLECLPLLDIYKEFNGLGPGIMCDMLDAGLKYQNVDIINMAFREFNIGDADPSQITSRVPQLVQTCLLSGNAAGMEMVMDFLRMHLLQLSKPDLDKIIELLNRHQHDQWIMNFGHIQSKRGVCSVCRSQMKEIEITDEEFSAVRNAFLNQVIIGKNIFYKSSVVEVKNFTHFIKVRNPFDVVIDGLNVVHKGRGGPSKIRLGAALNFFLDQKKNVLLLGSKILMKYLPRIKQPQLLHIFLTDTTKADDVFFLYAALHSGKDCLIVTSDKLRDHKFLLQKDLRPVFYKWLKSVQIHRWYSASENFDASGFSIVRRDIFDVGPVKDNDGWHIPLNDVEPNAPFGNMGVLCLRHKKVKNSEEEHTKLPDLQWRGSPVSQSDNVNNADVLVSMEHNVKLSDSHMVPKQYRAKYADSHLTSKHPSLKEKSENRKNNREGKKQNRNKLEWFEM